MIIRKDHPLASTVYFLFVLFFLKTTLPSLLYTLLHQSLFISLNPIKWPHPLNTPTLGAGGAVWDSRFSEKKNKVSQKYQIFISRDPYNLGQTSLDQQNISKVKHYF